MQRRACTLCPVLPVPHAAERRVAQRSASTRARRRRRGSSPQRRARRCHHTNCEVELSFSDRGPQRLSVDPARVGDNVKMHALVQAGAHHLKGDLQNGHADMAGVQSGGEANRFSCGRHRYGSSCGGSRVSMASRSRPLRGRVHGVAGVGHLVFVKAARVHECHGSRAAAVAREQRCLRRIALLHDAMERQPTERPRRARLDAQRLRGTAGSVRGRPLPCLRRRLPRPCRRHGRGLPLRRSNRAGVREWRRRRAENGHGVIAAYVGPRHCMQRHGSSAMPSKPTDPKKTDWVRSIASPRRHASRPHLPPQMTAAMRTRRPPRPAHAARRQATHARASAAPLCTHCGAALRRSAAILPASERGREADVACAA